VFPHHENEVAQSSCCNNGAKLANYWMHNGHLIVNGEKMSKSLGNFFTVQEKLTEVPGEVIRYILLATHYRQPLDWTVNSPRQAKNILDKFYNALQGCEIQEVDINSTIIESLQDDLNVPLALLHLHEIVSEIHKTDDKQTKNKLQNQLRVSANMLGLLYQDPELWFKSGNDKISASEIEVLIQDRKNARNNKDFALADKIRDALEAQGVLLLDNAEGTTWRYK
jgi:cysteinyl-tRNA synthetase